jgi:hypothetical protein
MSRSFPYVMLLICVATTLTGIVVIGETLLLVRFATENALVPVLAALVYTVLFGVIGIVLSWRASKLPPVRMPGPVQPRAPARSLDLGAGYLIGQFVLIVGAMLLLLFIILAIRS